MALTPVEIRHVKPARGIFGGYQRDVDDKLLEEIVASFEDVWRERADLADKVEQLQADLVRFRELESLLRRRSSRPSRRRPEMKDQARREAELILSEAHAEAREIQRPRPSPRTSGSPHESRRLRVQLQRRSGGRRARDGGRPSEPATSRRTTTSERSWYGLPDATLPEQRRCDVI